MLVIVKKVISMNGIYYREQERMIETLKDMVRISDESLRKATLRSVEQGSTIKQMAKELKTARLQMLTYKHALARLTNVKAA